MRPPSFNPDTVRDCGRIYIVPVMKYPNNEIIFIAEEQKKCGSLLMIKSRRVSLVDCFDHFLTHSETFKTPDWSEAPLLFNTRLHFSIVFP